MALRKLIKLLTNRLVFQLSFLTVLLSFSFTLFAQQNDKQTPEDKEDALKAPEKVEVKPLIRDREIEDRITNILTATKWFNQPEVKVNEGVVFLSGQTKNEEYKKWASELARKTENVAAVVNQIEVKPSIWDYSRALERLRTLWLKVVQALPSFIFSLVILILAWIAAIVTASLARLLLRKKLQNQLLREVTAKSIGFIVFLLGAYLVFEVAGLTTVALTVVGGTGLLGIILGIAFREITENILASIFLSIQQPFSNGDLIEIEGIMGYVQRLTMRATVLISLEGNHIQIPNALVYKEKIRNYTSNPKRREDFIVGIGYENPIPEAQKIALEVLANHPAVLKIPEPWVLVDNLGKAVINLKIYYWIDGDEHSWLKVRSSVIRQIKRVFQDHEISMPDEARELIFPKTVPIKIVPSEEKEAKIFSQKFIKEEKESISTQGESGLSNPAREIQEQASQSRIPEKGDNLLDSDKS